MKVKVRVPTMEQYGFVEVDLEQDTPESVVEAYDHLLKLFRPQDGLSDKEFNEALDRYLIDGTGETETYLKMSINQKMVIQEIKKAFKRINK